MSGVCGVGSVGVWVDGTETTKATKHHVNFSKSLRFATLCNSPP
jgi:hypothetical protein